jgi:hypothetical protein
MKPSRRFCCVHLLALLVGMTLLSTPLASASLTTDPPGKNPKNDTGPAAAAAVTTASAFAAAVISNGTVELGVNPEGHLDGAGVGDLFVPTGGDALMPGCLCEGWGLADLTSNVSGWASVDDGGISNVSVSRFDTTPSTAVSEVTIGSTFDVTQDYHPSSSSNLYEDVVTVKNISAAPVAPRYRRVMDWDVPPTEFDEYVTVAGSSPALAFSSDDGFASSDPLSGPSSIIATGTFTDSGPTDHGALFDFDLGSLAPNESTSFVIYYGAAASQADALSALNGVGAEVYSIGKPNTPDGLASGSPNTFAFGFIRNPGPTDVVVDPDGQTVTGGGASTTIGELPFGNTVERDLSGPGSTPLTFDVVLGPNDQLKQLADGSVEVQRNPTDWDAPAQAAAVPDTSAVPDVSDDELSSVITAAPTAALEDTDADSPPMPSGGNDVDPVYEGGDSAATDPDGMSLVEDAADATGDEVAAVLGVPQVTDANGNSVSASLAIDSATSHVTVQVGAGAAYPVHVKVLVGFNLLLEPGTASLHVSYRATDAASASPSRAGVASASTAAATSCPNMGRTIIWDPNGSNNLEPALDAYPASCMHYFIIQQGLASNKKKFDLSRASKIRANSNAPRVQAAGSKFHAAAVFSTGKSPQ